MLHHLTLWVPDLDRARDAWTWLLGELGYQADETVVGILLFRTEGGASLAMEQSPDMVPGMLYSRFRPGLNHLAFAVDDATTRRGDRGRRRRPRLVAPPRRHASDRRAAPR